MTSPEQAQKVFSAIVLMFRAVNHVHSSGVLLERSDIGLDRGLHPVLTTIGVDGPLRATDLADALALTPSTVSRHVARLEGLGLAERQVDPVDARASLIALTDSGRRTLEALNDTWEKLIAEQLEVAGITRPEALASDLAGLGAALESLSPHA